MHGAGLALALLLCAATPATAFDTALLERLAGVSGTLDADGVFTLRLPRGDLTVTTAGVRMTPPLGLTAWAALQPVGAQAMLMGDLVLAEDQVNPVMDAAFAGGLEVTALHNHFLWDQPKVMFMHVAGMGDPETLAVAIGKAFAAIKATAGGKGAVPRAAIDASTSQLDSAAIAAALGAVGTLNGGVYKVVIGRSVTMHGQTVGGAMGVNTWAAFAGRDDQAVVDGDFAVRESELQQTLRSLRGHGIAVTAIHNHMAGESPRMLFVHYWAVGPAAELAVNLRAVLAAQEK